MSGIISFGGLPEIKWTEASWIYRQFVSDVRATAPDDEEFVDTLQDAEYNKALSLPFHAQYDASFADQLYRAIIEVSTTTLRDQAKEGQAWQKGLDEEGQTKYLNAIRELLALAESCGGKFFSFQRNLSESTSADRELSESMTGILAVRNLPDETFPIPGWAFHRLLADLLAATAPENDLAIAFAQAKETHSLSLERMARAQPELARRLYGAMKRVAATTLQGSEEVRLNWKNGLDDAYQSRYIEYIKSLAAVLDSLAASRRFGKSGDA